MKKNLLLTLLLCFNLCCFSQSMKNDFSGKIGISYSNFGERDIVRMRNILGDPSYSIDNFFSVGFVYVRLVNYWLELEAGIEYLTQKVDATPIYPNSVKIMLGNIDIINVSLTVRANFLKYFFANGGLLVDLDVSKNSKTDKQNGIGEIMGLGAKYDFDFGGSVFINPYAKIHALIPFNGNVKNQRYLNKVLGEDLHTP